jgi:hypothetical protein
MYVHVYSTSHPTAARGEIVDTWNSDRSITRQFDVSGTGPYAGTTSAACPYPVGPPRRAYRAAVCHRVASQPVAASSTTLITSSPT